MSGLLFPKYTRDIKCNCRIPLIVLCAVGTEQGCWERRHHGKCSCEPRLLPSCLLTSTHGCNTWREGKVCSCPPEEMPCCMVRGCDERRQGHRCQCPRTPAKLCRHYRKKLVEYAALTPQEADRLADKWSERLWAQNPSWYEDRPIEKLAGSNARAGRHAVNIMRIRQSMGRSLWHPDDHRWPPGELERRLVAGLARLFSPLKGVAT